ncbi:MAG: penicillin-binding protein 1C, partial [Anderseniella sp.]|nr:penicillin-binding protein 1C [Anderseniella sp.]
MKRVRAIAVAAVFAAGVGLGGYAGLVTLDRAYPPPLPSQSAYSVEVVDRDGALLRAFAAPDGRWRLPVELDEVDPEFVQLLIAYEDRRFYAHHGVDPLALGRAAWQMLRHGRIVSGGSTITMQLARLLEPRTERSFGAKLLQLVRAVQIERRLGKREILELYLGHAPYGGNLEGIRSASLAWFGKEPRSLSLSEASLLAALPQAPESRRPDRFPDRARAARSKVLARAAETDVITAPEVTRAESRPVPRHRQAMPALAAHLADDVRRSLPSKRHHQLTLSRPVQERLTALASEAARRLPPGVSIAMVMADAKTGGILAEVGSAEAFDAERGGWIDMTRVRRSPGSALKPFIFALALEDGLVMPETMIDDSPASFDGYRPRNFDMSYQGEVTVRKALQLSLNVPAVRLLQSTGPSRLLARLRRAGFEPGLSRDTAPGLAIGLGGVGVSLLELVQAYTMFANGGQPAILGDGALVKPEPPRRTAMFEPVATWHVADILSGAAGPAGTARLPIAFKTGTSYGYRDAWSVGFDGRHVLGVWVGRPDGAPVPGISGITTAAPVLFEGFVRSGVVIEELPSAPAGAVRIDQASLPVSLRRFMDGGELLPPVAGTEQAPAIVYPPDGARIELGIASGGDTQPLVLKLQG